MRVRSEERITNKKRWTNGLCGFLPAADAEELSTKAPVVVQVSLLRDLSLTSHIELGLRSDGDLLETSLEVRKSSSAVLWAFCIPTRK
jgi:hypothetical protein